MIEASSESMQEKKKVYQTHAPDLQPRQSRRITLTNFFVLFLLLTTPAIGQWAMHVGGVTSDYVSGMTVDGSGNVYITGYFGGTGDFDPGAGTTNLTSAGNSDIFFAKYNTSGALQWAKSLGGTGDDRSFGIAVDGNGNIYLTGFFNGTADFDPSGATSNLTSAGGTDIFFAKYSTSGALIWAKSVGGTTGDEGHAIATDGSNVYVAGSFSADVDFDPGAGTSNITPVGGVNGFFAEYGSAGELIWAKSISGSSTDILGIALDGIGSVHIVGYFNGTADFDPSGSTANLIAAGTYDGFIAQYDNFANWQWSYQLGGAGDDRVQSITIDGNNDFCISGNFEQTVDFNLGVGTANRTSAGFSDMFIAKYDGSAGFQWANAIGGNGFDLGYCVAVDASLNVYITGANSPSGSYFAKFNSAGTIQWSNTVGSSVPDDAKSIAVDGSGNVYLAGVFSGTADFEPGAGTTNLTSTGLTDIYFAKYQSTGALPVELISLGVLAHERNSKLDWSTASETNNYGFEVQRSSMINESRIEHGTLGSAQSAMINWTRIGFVEGSGSSNAPREYSFVDKNLGGGN